MYFFSDIVHKIPNFPTPKIGTFPKPEKKDESQTSSKNSPWMLGECKSKSSWAEPQKMEKFSNKTGHWSDLEVSWNGSPKLAPSHHGFQHQNSLIEVIILQ